MKKLTDLLSLEPGPCPSCGTSRPYTVYVGGGHEGMLPFWCRIQCRNCGRRTAKKLFCFRAVRTWNRDAIK